MNSVANSAWLAPAWANDPATAAGGGGLQPTPAPGFASDHTLHGRFVERAARTPDAVAVISRDRRLTYGDVDAESARVASLLVEHGTTKGTLVGVVMDKGWEQVVGSLGVLRSGGAYVPVDPRWPAQRLAEVIAAAGLETILTQPALRDVVDWPDGVTVLDVEAPSPVENAAVHTAPDVPVTPRDVAYVIYTSGSTGVPKGVVIEHGPVVNTILDVNDELSLSADDRVLGLSALNFDLSVYDIFGPLSAGGAVVLPGPEDAREPASWLALMAEESVTVWNSVPALMAMVCEHLASSEDTGPRSPGAPSSLRAVLMSGDWIPVALPDEIRRFFPRAALWSLGGATEASIWSIWHRIVPEDATLPSIPYGTSMRNQKVFVADSLLRPRPTWVVGEICIAGAGLAREYLGDTEKTAKSFTVSPSTGERVYRTGDWGRLLPGGEIEFLGRDDMQVKVGGYRIELGDVEAALLRCPGVTGAVVTAPGDRNRKRLVAHVVLEEGAGRTGADVRKAAEEFLPPYMLPSLVTVWDALPLTANGKVDRASLARHEEEPDPEDENARPDTEEEQVLLSLWKDFFETSSLSVLDNFFELGGDSLRAVRLMAVVRKELNVSLPVSTLFSAPTIRSLAGRVQESRAAA
ncbi:amino acid adenylation domain-containing protein [Streptomyces afghaniensis]|uniref:non-ribosomal peptide synthetase n=1 Tax=Streptomyces afghaniensis TaxID=66865 RepID=UPI00040C1D6B|nr:non-ribosomal peptide synthetase [Streptomyces afghaniensis]